MMKIYSGTVTGSQITINRDGDQPVVMLQANLTDDNDTQSIEYVPQPGEDVTPADGTEVIVLEISKGYKIAIAGDDRITPTMGKGEKKIYSVNNGAIAAFINWLQSGVVEINGNARDAARKDDATISTSIEDPTFWAYLAAVDLFLRGLGFLGPPVPTSQTGKINDGTDKVKLP